MSDEKTHSGQAQRAPRSSRDELRVVAEQTGTSIEDVLDAIDAVGPDRVRVIALLRRKAAGTPPAAKAS